MSRITEHVTIARAGKSHETWQELREYNFEAVVNMRSEVQDTFSAPWPKAYLWIPVEDHASPTPDQFLLGAQFIAGNVKSGHKELIHRKMGIHHSATMVVAYLIITGFSKNQAIRKLAEKGPRLYETDEDHQVLDAFSKLVDTRR